jgi:hypothetical protein
MGKKSADSRALQQRQTIRAIRVPRALGYRGRQAWIAVGTRIANLMVGKPAARRGGPLTPLTRPDTTDSLRAARKLLTPRPIVLWLVPREVSRGDRSIMRHFNKGNNSDLVLGGFNAEEIVSGIRARPAGRLWFQWPPDSAPQSSPSWCHGISDLIRLQFRAIRVPQTMGSPGGASLDGY